MELKNGECSYCAVGYSSDGSSPCHRCSSGSAASDRVRYFDSWPAEDWPSGTGTFTTGCTGKEIRQTVMIDLFLGDNCLGAWRRGYWFTDSGLGHGSGTESSMQLEVPVIPHSQISVNFTYLANCNTDIDQWVFYINGYALYVGSCAGCQATYLCCISKALTVKTNAISLHPNCR
jgi:hypothetical protein